MSRRDFWTGISLIPVFGVCCLGCTIVSAPQAGTGGAPGAAGSGGGLAPATGGVCGGAAPPAPAAGAPQGPCDIYAADGGPCVAAHSTVRALYSEYSGPLYQVKKADGSVQDIFPLTPGGLAKSADQDTFCGTGACTISTIYDQSGKGNHLTQAPPGERRPTLANEANAKSISLTVSGQKVYGVHVVPGVGYRNTTACGTATGDNPETEYMVVAGNFSNGSCCFDYGNMETNSMDNGEGTMEAVYFGTCTVWGTGGGAGPWVMGDLENGLWAGNISPFPANTPVTYNLVTGMVKGDAAGRNHWTIKVGNAQSGVLAVPFDGQRPSERYNPMRKEGAIGLGTGGDASNGAQGNFFEGVMTSAYASSAADDAVQASIVSVYGLAQ